MQVIRMLNLYEIIEAAVTEPLYWQLEWLFESEISWLMQSDLERNDATDLAD